MKRWRVVLFVAAIPAFVAGCASDKPAFSEQEEAAIRFNQRGQLAFQLGDYATAVEEYEAALAMHRSHENVNGIAIELMNLALAHRRLGHKAAAQESLDPLLAAKGALFTSLHQAEAAYRRATFFLDDGDTRQAQHWTDQALKYCRGCATEGRLHNLKARMLLARKNIPEAVNHARRALDLNRNAGDKVEAANSSRLLADAAFAAGDFRAAQLLYDETYRLDKAAGSTKLALDLMGVGNSLVRQGKTAEASQYFRRAHSVAEGAGNLEVMEAAALEVKRLSP